MFIECLRRSAVKLECISAAIDRAIARAASSVGQNVSRPAFSARYSTIARLSHTPASPSHTIGTLPEEGPNSSPSRRWLQPASESGTPTTPNQSPACLLDRPLRTDPDATARSQQTNSMEQRE